MPQTLAIWVVDAALAIGVGAETAPFVGEAILVPAWPNKARADHREDGDDRDGD
jgi:hypothetical protein